MVYELLRSLCVCIVRVQINNEELFLMLSPFWIGLDVVRSMGNLSRNNYNNKKKNNSNNNGRNGSFLTWLANS